VNYCRFNCNNISGLPEVKDRLTEDNSWGSQAKTDNLSFKEKTECYF